MHGNVGTAVEHGGLLRPVQMSQRAAPAISELHFDHFDVHEITPMIDRCVRRLPGRLGRAALAA
jgi:hypothetical protein